MLKDWTTYVYAGIVVALALGILAYNVNFDIYKTDETADKQYNEPDMKVGVWRVARLPARGAPLEVGMLVVFQVRGCEIPRVSRIVALEGQKVELKNDQLTV